MQSTCCPARTAGIDFHLVTTSLKLKMRPGPGKKPEIWAVLNFKSSVRRARRSRAHENDVAYRCTMRGSRPRLSSTL